MPNLIQVPNSKDQIAGYLADGVDTSVPAVQNADVNDGDILNATRTLDAGNNCYKFSITLPSGRALESAPVGPDYSRTDAALQWVEAVRGAIVDDAANAARASRDAHLAEARERDLRSSGAGGSNGGDNIEHAAAPEHPGHPLDRYGITDPVDFAKQQLRDAMGRLSALSAAQSDVERWSRVVESLTGVRPVDTRPAQRGVKKRRKKRNSKANVPTGTIGV